MDIHGPQSATDRSQRAFEERQRTVIDSNRALVRAAHDSLAAGDATRPSVRRDAVELSAAAQAANEPSPAEREAHVRELTEAYRMGRLHSPERLERAAQRLLGAD